MVNVLVHSSGVPAIAVQVAITTNIAKSRQFAGFIADLLCVCRAHTLRPVTSDGDTNWP
jgi:hypothetical protein